GVVLMTYGSASTADDVPAYLRSIRRGRDASPELIEEFTARYRRIGFSPLVRITMAQGQALQEVLDGRHGRGTFRVEVGMLHSEPRIAAALERFAAAAVSRVVGVVLAPQYSPIILAGYHRELEASAHLLGPEGRVTIAGAWGDQPTLIEAIAGRTREAIAALPEETRDSAPIVLTAHSLPRPVVDRDPGYIDQLKQTADLVAAAAGLAPGRWQFAYQSAGHTPEEWLRPDVKELLPAMHRDGVRDVIVVPVQFISDHLETLYDIDVAAVEEAAADGITMRRIPALNTAPDFIGALAAVVEGELAAVTATV
ncbi:MAG: ferrochelatase, partial [Candidatus Dormibacteria bacterium]